MKKQLFLIMTILAATANYVSAQVTFTIDKVSLPQNGECELPIKFQVDGNDSYSGWQFNIELTEGLEFVTDENNNIDFITGDCYDEVPLLSTNLVDGVLNVGCLTANANPLTEKDGTLVTFKIRVDQQKFAIGEQLTGKLFGARISTSSGVSKHLDDCPFIIVIAAPIDTRIVLDETAIIVPEAIQSADVRVKRTLNADEWSTIVLPFAMTEAQIKAAFGENVKLGDFNDYEVSADGGTIMMKFKETAAIAANHPYIIKVGTDISEFTADNVDIDPQEAVVDFDTDRRHRYPRKMVGVYEAGTILEWGTLYLSNSQFWYSTGSSTLNAFHAYFDFTDLLPDFENNYNPNDIKMVFESDEAGIQGLTIQETETMTFDLQGRPVTMPAKGIYVKDGKKMVIK